MQNETTIKPTFKELLNVQIPDNFTERPPCSSEDLMVLNERLVALTDMLGDNPPHYIVDGGLSVTIRLMAQGLEPLGLHKDVDFGILFADLPAWIDLLERKGMGLFVSKAKDPRGLVRCYNVEEALAFSPDWWQFARFDEQGEISREQQPLGILDVHVNLQSENGRVQKNSGITIPSNWIEGEMVNYKDLDLNVQDIRNFAYHKILLYMTKSRFYDAMDLAVAYREGIFTPSDVEDVRRLFKSEAFLFHEKIKRILANISTQQVTAEDLKDLKYFCKIFRVSSSGEFINNLIGQPENVALEILQLNFNIDEMAEQIDIFLDAVIQSEVF